MKEVVEMKDLDSNFKNQVMSEPNGQNITKCFSCGTCTASCPVREIDEIFNPRKIIHMVLLGMKETVLKSEFVWLCSTCYACFERCPQDVRITELMNAIKNVAVKEGFIHPAFTAQAELIYNNGRLYDVDDFINKKRNKAELPQIENKPAAIKKIFSKTGLNSLVEGGKA